MPAIRILALLKKHKKGSTLDQILSELGVKRRDRAKLLDEVRRLEARGDVRVFRGRFRLTEKTGVVRGRFVTARPGFGFVTPEGGGADIFVPARFAHGALPGDEVAVVVNEQGKFGKPEGRIERILKKDRTGLLGVYVERERRALTSSRSTRPSVDDIPLKSRGRLRPEPGMIVEADRTTLALTRVFGRPEDPGVDARVVIRALRPAVRVPRGRPRRRPRPSRTSIAAAALARPPGFPRLADRDDRRREGPGLRRRRQHPAARRRRLAARRPHRRRLPLRPAREPPRPRGRGPRRRASTFPT